MRCLRCRLPTAGPCRACRARKWSPNRTRVPRCADDERRVEQDEIEAAVANRREQVALAKLDARVEAIVGTLLGNGPLAVAAAKRLIRENLALGRDAAIENSVRAIAGLRASEEGQEGLSAFLEKRRPAWKV